jgi:hypothetical protein
VSERPRCERPIACTIGARNFLPYAKTLARTFRLHHPSIPVVVLLVDEEASPASPEPELFDIVSPRDLGLSESELHMLAAMYGPRELSTALKPALLRSLLERADAVLFLDPDMAVYHPMADVFELAATHGIVLTPHLLVPPPRDRLSPTEIELALTGTYNGGFVAVGQGASGFLDWWWERLRRDCVFARSQGLFVDQRWLDWVPAYYEHHILRDPTVNVAHWNVHERELSSQDGQVTVGSRPLRLFHFSGYRPERPDVLTTHTYRHSLRVESLAAAPELRRLCDEYRSWLLSAGHGDRLTEYGFSRTADGEVITSADRAAFRQSLIASERRGSAPPPDPFDPAASAAFRRWRGAARRAGLSGRLERRLRSLLKDIRRTAT